MPRRTSLLIFICICMTSLRAQDLSGIEIHGFATQGLLFSTHNNYITMDSSSGNLQWTDGALSVSDSLTDKLRVGMQFHMYELGQLGGPYVQVDWASGDYRFNDFLGIRAGKVKTVAGLFNDSQDVDALYLWCLLPQSIYPIDNKSFFLSHVGGEAYGGLPLGNHAGRLRYDVYAGQITLDPKGGYVKDFADVGVAFTSPPSGKIFGGDLRWEAPLTGLTVGVSSIVEGLDGTAPGIDLHIPASGVNAEYAQYKKGKFYFAGEYRRLPFNAFITIGPEEGVIPVDSRSWYAMGSYRFRKKFQAGSYYSHSVNKAGDTSQPANYSKDWAVSGRYDFNAYFYGKIEGHFLHGTEVGYYTSTNPNGLQPNTDMLAAKVGFSF